MLSDSASASWSFTCSWTLRIPDLITVLFFIEYFISLHEAKPTEQYAFIFFANTEGQSFRNRDNISMDK